MTVETSRVHRIVEAGGRMKYIIKLEAESETKDEVIRRLLGGWLPFPRLGFWTDDVNRREPMPDAHRAVLENL
jgi:hypothetical protein